MTVVINVSSRLVSDIDPVNAIQAFRLLWDGGHNIVPGEVHAWALANGWPPRGAYSLRKIAERIAAGRTFIPAKEVGISLFDPASLRTWRERARVRFIPHPSTCGSGNAAG